MRMGFADLVKLLFSFIVCLYHFFGVVSPNPYFPLGKTAVELFVIVAGIFFFHGWETKAASSQGGISPYAYLKKRFFRFFPYSLVGYSLAFAVSLFLSIQDGARLGLKATLSSGVWDVLMVKMIGINNNATLMNTPAWTFSTMLLSEFFIAALLHNNKKLFETLIAPLVICVGMGLWCHTPSARHELWIGFTTFGMMRVFILYCLSWYAYKLCCRIRQLQFTRSGRIIITITELFCYCCAIWIMMTQTSRYFQWLTTLFLLIAAALSASGRTGTAFRLPCSRWISEFSMGIYLIHYPIMELFCWLYPSKEVVIQYGLPYFLAVLAAAALFAWLLPPAVSLVRKVKDEFWSRMTIPS